MTTPIFLIMMTTMVLNRPTEMPPLEIKEGKFYEANTMQPYNGFYTHFFESTGIVECEGPMKNGLPNNVWTFYYANGKLKTIAEYVDGICIRTLKAWHLTGELKASYDKDSLTYTEWFQDGSVKTIVHYLHGMKQGSSVEYYENGKVKSEYNYYHHHEHGICKEYFESGQVSLIAIYRDGKKSGLWQAFYPDGRLKYQGRFSDDIKTGQWITRNEMGKLTRKTF